MLHAIARRSGEDGPLQPQSIIMSHLSRVSSNKNGCFVSLLSNHIIPVTQNTWEGKRTCIMRSVSPRMSSPLEVALRLAAVAAAAGGLPFRLFFTIFKLNAVCTQQYRRQTPRGLDLSGATGFFKTCVHINTEERPLFSAIRRVDRRGRLCHLAAVRQQQHCATLSLRRKTEQCMTTTKCSGTIVIIQYDKKKKDFHTPYHILN